MNFVLLSFESLSLGTVSISCVGKLNTILKNICFNEILKNSDCQHKKTSKLHNTKSPVSSLQQTKRFPQEF